MVIRKLYKFEGAHIVRNCSSDRCSKSIHGHSYQAEVFLSANHLDKGQMIYDFGLMKNEIKDFIDSFDHTYVFWAGESERFKNNIKSMSDRWIELPVSPTAECLSLVFLDIINDILHSSKMKNGEGDVYANSVRIHETDTGYAEAFPADLPMLDDITGGYDQRRVVFSQAIREEWKTDYLKKINDLY